MYSFHYWRPGQSWSVLEGEAVAFLEDSYGLGDGRKAQISQNWFNPAPTGRLGQNITDLQRNHLSVAFTYFFASQWN